MAQVHGFFAILYAPFLYRGLDSFRTSKKGSRRCRCTEQHSGARECSEIRFHPSGKVIARDRMVVSESRDSPEEVHEPKRTLAFGTPLPTLRSKDVFDDTGLITA
jgi:hypothetical protein